MVANLRQDRSPVRLAPIIRFPSLHLHHTQSVSNLLHIALGRLIALGLLVLTVLVVAHDIVIVVAITITRVGIRYYDARRRTACVAVPRRSVDIRVSRHEREHQTLEPVDPRLHLIRRAIRSRRLLALARGVCRRRISAARDIVATDTVLAGR